MKRVLVVLSGLVLTCCSPTTRTEHNGPSVQARQSFTIDLPPSCALEGGERRLDFAVFQVICAEAPQIGIYAGNAPNVDQDREGLTLRSDNPRRSAIVAPDESVRGYLLETQYSWPSRLHVWIDAGRENDVLAKRIAASVRPTEPSSAP